ncbi:hypothetical protein D9615_005609 [Tricholomella constricta]|uniref:Uncharacterized protein n=1 Tax=Tricholomella constricta TaxID=117010 RepID=A0A8H5M5K3_9AGAR|nr:hypothetical protein D9615_005609 [Tricholomella constricta]
MVLNLRRLSGRSSRDRTSQDFAGFGTASPTDGSSPLAIDTNVSPFEPSENKRWSRRTSSSSHNLLAQAPSASRESLTTGADDSLCTESSGSTVPGPGVLTGRVIKALGNIAVLQIDNMLIRRRMSVYRNIFPHGRRVDETEDDGREMYSEILEFTRPGVYPAAVRKEALELLMIQINIRETHQLMRALNDNFDYEDLRAFLFQIVDYDTQANQQSSSPIFAEQEANFASSIPLAFFIFRLSFSPKKSHRVAVDSFLLAMCAKKSLLADHLLRIFKFGQDSDYLDSLYECAPEERQTLWKVLGFLRRGEIPYLEERLRSRTGRIDEVLKQQTSSYQKYLPSVCFDLVEFSRNGLDHLIDDVRVWAFSRIFTFLARGGEFWDVLISTLGKVPHGDQYRIMSRILYCTLPALNLSPGTSDQQLVDAYRQAFWDHECLESHEELEAHIFGHFFRFVIQAFSRQGSLRAALMLDQNFLSIIVLCLSPPQVPSTSAELLRLITENPVTR